MGYRLHYAPVFKVDWMGGFFNWRTEEWNSLFYDKFYENGWKSENEDQCEVDRNDLSAYIKEIAVKPSSKNAYFNEYKNKEVVEALQEILDGSTDDYIRMEWF